MLEVQKKVLGDLWKWDKEVLGELERRIKNAKRELERIGRRSISQDQVNREYVLRFKLERLQDQLHVYWKQRAHTAWLTKGDRNTKFFHAYASERRRRNHIKKLKDDSGGEVQGRHLKQFIANQYQNLFLSLAGGHEDFVIDRVQRRVTQEMNESLLAPFSGEEVWKALESIGDLKAPGPDGMPAVFYKQFWNLIGEKVKKEVLEVLNGGNMPQGWNNTIIVLIPKTKQPERLKDLRPISLCNILYKLVSKVLTNRLKNILPDVVSPSQSAFVPGRMITDNVLLAYELTHHLLNTRRKGSDGFAAIKLDMSKAYDRVEWPFLEKIMRKLGFHERWVNLTMKCVSTVSYRIKVNGEYTESFFPQKGLRQGDPLSPYLFILCAEGLSALLLHAEVEGRMQGIKVCSGAPTVNHLFFADDSLILMKAREADAQVLKQILEAYELASGQVINKDKSSILFSPNTTSHIKQSFRSVFSINQEAMNERYLGLPVAVGRSRKKAFEYIKNKVWACIQGWQEKLLSKAGKEVLVKAVAQAIPTYATSCFDLTKSLCDELSSMIGRYWWSQQDKTNKVHWLAWDQLTRSKKFGGLGFRDLHLFNLAMLARQAWRLLLAPDTLCGQVLKAKFFPNSNILHCKARSGISYTWRSILKGVELLKKGIIWRIGDGCSTYIWKDPWIPRGSTRRPITPQGPSLLSKVSDLIDPGTGRWDEQLVRDTFWEEDAEVILSIPIDADLDDFSAWHFDPKGIFSVKSAYKLAVQIRDHERGRDASTSAVISATTEGDDFKWYKIWQLKFPNKVNMFIWRLAHNSLPVKRNLARRGIKTETACPLCFRLDEDCGHLFFKCKKAKQCWRAMNLEHVRANLELCKSGKETVARILNLEQHEQNGVFIWLEVVLATNCKDKAKSPSARWRPPPADYYKINVDASYHEVSKQGGWGFVARDANGIFLEGGAGSILHVADAQQAETLGVLRSLERIVELGMTRIILETDSSTVGRAITSSEFDRSPNGCLFRQIRDFIASNFVQCTVNRPRPQSPTGPNRGTDAPPPAAPLRRPRAAGRAPASASPATLALYNYPTFAGAYAALAARLFHQRVSRRLLALPFSSVEPFRAEDFKDAGFQTCYLLDFIGPRNFAFELSRFVPSVIAFDHRQSTLASIPKLGQCPSNVELHIDTSKGSARSAFDYFSKKLAGTNSDSRMWQDLLDQEDVERVSNVLEYIEDADLRRWQLPNTKEFQTALRDERAKLNCVTNPHVFEQAAGEFIQKPFKLQLGRGSYGECLAIRADGHKKLSHEIGLELSLRSAAAGLRPIGAVVFMQRGILKVCLRTTDSATNTAEIAKAYGGGGKPSSSSFPLRMDEFNAWTSVNS
ncbi:hypothetical protein U9M48_005117 [Paspalum notatum var. saurae]|uniref:Reverse transcriptase domain-containing protein n=1 Tax=Paspalum notatum var. saurae TaxID=547442 RepID=A0AAQ3PPG3_PASNO